MTGYFRVRNFERFQHYKDRNPPWIRLYGALWRDRAFFRLPDEAKAHLIGLFTIAARLDNRIPEDPQWLAHELCATSPIDIQALADAGFLVREPADSKPPASPYRRASGSVSDPVPEAACDPVSVPVSDPAPTDKPDAAAAADPGDAGQMALGLGPHAGAEPAAPGPGRARAWPAGFALSESMRAFAQRMGIEAEAEFEAWRDDCAAHCRRYADWGAAWRNRCRNALRFAPRTNPAPRPRPETPVDTALRRLREAADRDRLREVS